MKRALTILGRVLLAIAAVAAMFLLVVRLRHGGGSHLEDRWTTDPALPESALETVADLPLPPGNVAVSRSGRVFFTFHPEAGPDVKVAELVDGKPVPYPDAASQKPRDDGPSFDTPLALRIDAKDRLWVLDYARHGAGAPKLLAFDLATNRLVHEFEFPSDVAGLGSMLNDCQISPDANRIYIADASIFRNRGAIVTYDVERRRARRLLEAHPAVQAMPYVTRVRGRDMVVLGVFTVRPNVDSIALDKRGEWLYFAPVTSTLLYRIRARDLDDESLSNDDLSHRIEVFAEKPMSDGITIDAQDQVYLSDMEHDAIHRLDRQGELKTLLKSDRIRWPDGFSFGPGGWLYFTCSSLQEVIFQPRSNVDAHAPYQIFRFKPGTDGVPGQ
ncbi:MAG TPA: L-dopachrome tautomerase-related protein [Candidatus Binatia bacterium]|nr:L-dopachrome tautomerase-related protein [Candidatus Binatia bacterium]